MKKKPMEKNIVKATDLIAILQSAVEKFGDQCMVNLFMDESRYAEYAELLVSSSENIVKYENSDWPQRNALVKDKTIIRAAENEISHVTPNW